MQLNDHDVSPAAETSLNLMRALWYGAEVEVEGDFYRVLDVQSDTHYAVAPGEFVQGFTATAASLLSVADKGRTTADVVVNHDGRILVARRVTTGDGEL